MERLTIKKLFGGQVDAWTVLLLAALILNSLSIRFFLFDYQTSDFLAHLEWFRYIGEQGGWGSFREQFSPYNPSYLYLLTLAHYLPLQDTYAVKIVSIVFDYVAAWWVYRLVRLRYGSPLLPLVAFLAVVFAPTVILNSSMWGQFDSIFASCLLGSLFFMVRLSMTSPQQRRRSVMDASLALGFFALALSVKLQAIFFVLPLLFLFVSRRVPVYLGLVLVAAYLALLLPSSVLGASWVDLLSVYVQQIGLHQELVVGVAPTAYVFFRGAPADMMARVGIVFALSAIVFFTWLLVVGRVRFTPEAVMRIALLSALMVPYLLPRMHERYFFTAELVALVYAFYWPRLWFVPLGLMSVSLFVYAPFLFRTQSPFNLALLALAVGLIIIVVIKDFLIHHLLSGRTAEPKVLRGR